MTEHSSAFHDQRSKIRTTMGGEERVAAVHARGGRTIREHIEALVDPGSFEEVGTFAASESPAQRESTPGDGKIGGHAALDGRPISVVGDDVTVKRGSSSVVGGRRVSRIYEQALRQGNPIIYLGETGGARVPDSLGSVGLATIPPPGDVARRRRRIPMASIIVGESYGGSSFLSAMSDLTIQVRGSTMAVTSPRVIESATGERMDAQALGGADVHATVTGQIDLVADSYDEAYDLVRRFLSYLPANSWSDPPRGPDAEVGPDPGLAQLVPTSRRQAYDMRKVIARLADHGRWLELRPKFGRSLLTGLAHIGGTCVGLIASQPMQQAGVLTPDACDKAVRLICLCDAFDIPIVFLQDSPGFLVGQKPEHARLLYKAILLLQAVSLARTPKLSVVLRKGFGLAYFALGGNDMGTDMLWCWPSAEISLMDPDVGASVVNGSADADVAAMLADVGPWGAAGIMKVDEIIDPEETRSALAGSLARLQSRDRSGERPLASWPTCW
jgi:methylmalonyl-CoA decarboxylase subunit alpha